MIIVDLKKGGERKQRENAWYDSVWYKYIVTFLEGKDYIMQDGDVVHFRFNV